MEHPSSEQDLEKLIDQDFKKFTSPASIGGFVLAGSFVLISGFFGAESYLSANSRDYLDSVGWGIGALFCATPAVYCVSLIYRTVEKNRK